ncbi:hypothetical protein A2732_01185, partial [Candidatus Nomurabacteria bacterium RIFCSPHIGHO2_01_FULL_40_10]
MISLNISISKQKLNVLDGEKVIKTYPVSTSRFGTGFENGSKKTPTGNFMILEKIGGLEPIFTTFKGRKPAGVWDGKPTDDDLVLSRILWLDDIDNNRNTKDRYIYIHGTNHENLIGTPASHGCIRMNNRDVIEL